MSKVLYSNLVEAATDLLGPAADRFMTRHIENHLDIKPKDITPQHLPELEAWLKPSLCALTPDTAIIDVFILKIRSCGK